MTDKVQKIREEVERLKGWNNNVRNSTRHMTLQEEDFNRGKHSSYLEILNFIDSLQEEPQVKKLVGSQHEYKMCKENGNSLTQEPVSESIDFEQELYKAFGQIKDFTLGVAIAKSFYDMGRKHNEPVSEDLEEEIDRAHRIFYDEVGWDSDEGARAYVADWFAHYFANWQKTQVIKNAIEVTVHIDAGGYPYIPQIELYDYDKDVPLAKEGDRYKVVLIKED